MKPYRPPLDRRALQALGGNMSQFAGIRRCFLEDGRARGVEALDFDNGSGFRFTVLPGRGMDIAAASYCGTPLCFVAKPGVASAAEYDPRGMGWLRNFFAGLLTTCGLSNVGDPCEDEETQLGRVHHGLHGRMTNTGAENVCYESRWEADDQFVLRASGRMREAVLHAEALTLSRTIDCRMGKNALRIEDVVENEGFETRPLMLLYHINAGHPVLSAKSELIIPSLGARPGSEAALREPDSCGVFSEPTPGAEQFVYDHAMGVDENGLTQLALVNPSLELGLYVRYNVRELPRLAQWKRMSAGDYVVGLEPANVRAIGRAAARECGELPVIEPGEKKTFRLEIGVLDGAEEIGAFRERVRRLQNGAR